LFTKKGLSDRVTVMEYMCYIICYEERPYHKIFSQGGGGYSLCWEGPDGYKRAGHQCKSKVSPKLPPVIRGISRVVEDHLKLFKNNRRFQNSEDHLTAFRNLQMSQTFEISKYYLNTSEDCEEVQRLLHDLEFVAYCPKISEDFLTWKGLQFLRYLEDKGSCQLPKKSSVLQAFTIFLMQFGITKHF